MKRRAIWITLLLLSIVLGSSIAGAGDGYPWMDHAFPFDFPFGNHIDSHQQSRLMSNDELFGFLYITFTDEFTAEGVPVARHCSEETPPDECVAGWVLRGKPGRATFVFHCNDHPVWLVEKRADIPQPGAFSHFHWLGAPAEPGGLVPGQSYDGYFIELQAINTFAFLHAGEQIPVVPGIDIATHVNIVGSFPSMADCSGEHH